MREYYNMLNKYSAMTIESDTGIVTVRFNRNSYIIKKRIPTAKNICLNEFRNE